MPPEKTVLAEGTGSHVMPSKLLIRTEFVPPISIRGFGVTVTTMGTAVFWARADPIVNRELACPKGAHVAPFTLLINE
jgi:hypothetical protein